MNKMAKPIWESKSTCPPLVSGNVIDIGQGYFFLIVGFSVEMSVVQIKPNICLVPHRITQRADRLVNIENNCAWRMPIQRIWASLEDFYGYAK